MCPSVPQLPFARWLDAPFQPAYLWLTPERPRPQVVLWGGNNHRTETISLDPAAKINPGALLRLLDEVACADEKRYSERCDAFDKRDLAPVAASHRVDGVVVEIRLAERIPHANHVAPVERIPR